MKQGLRLWPYLSSETKSSFELASAVWQEITVHKAQKVHKDVNLKDVNYWT